MQLQNPLAWYITLVITLEEVIGADDDYNVLHRYGSYEFGYNNPDSYHYADANRNNVVKGEFGGKNPATGAFDSTIYTAGPRGFRPRGKNVVRKYDLNQSGPRPIGSRDDPYYDPYEDPSYNFAFRTRTYNREENANRVGDVNGRYSYVDDVGERHNVEFIAGKNTGFHVKTPFPDSNPRAYGPLYFKGRGKPIPRGRTSIQRGLDGSYKFVSAGPDQRRTETSDSTGHVRGSYTYLDDKGVQHSVHYIAGPETGYRVLKQVKGPHLPTVFPFGQSAIIPPDFYDDNVGDVFDTAATGHLKPTGKPGKKDEIPAFSNEMEGSQDDFSFGSKKPFGSAPGASSFGKPSYEDDTSDFGDLFGDENDGRGSTTTKPSALRPGGGRKPGLAGFEDDGLYRPSGQDGSYQSTTAGYDINTTSKPKGFESKGPSYGARPTKRPYGKRPGVTAGDDYLEGSLPPRGRPNFNSEDGNYKPRPVDSSDSGYGGGRPSPSFDEGEIKDNFGLFGSETNHPRPPYGYRPIINIGDTSDSCKKCKGTLLTNVGDRVFSVPPGVSVRAHVQAIDLLPINPNVPSPREQYMADMSFKKTEQLNAEDDGIVEKDETATENTTTEETTTNIISTTTSTSSKD